MKIRDALLLRLFQCFSRLEPVEDAGDEGGEGVTIRTLNRSLRLTEPFRLRVIFEAMIAIAGGGEYR